jgi:hypothetical protein
MSDSEPQAPPPRPPLVEIVSSALAFWEPRRIFYNVVLAAIVVVRGAGRWSLLHDSVTFPTVLTFFILAVLANLCYSAAYIPDVFIQLSRYRQPWIRWRWGLWLVGTAFAAAITFLLTAEGLQGGPYSGS